MPYPAWHPESLAARLPFLRRRALLTQATRAFFIARGYTEVETPYAVPTPGEEVHLRAFATTRERPDGATDPLWLHTSPEFAMKKLLVGGAGQIFQLARVWRNGEAGDLHAPEFTMLEWYHPGATMDVLIAETTALLRAVLPPIVTCRGVTTDLGAVERLTLARPSRTTSAPTCWPPRTTRRRSPPPRAPACVTMRPGRTCSSACCWSASSRGSAARIPPS